MAIIDQLSVSVPFARCLLGCKVLFYCHFPDKLLAMRAPAGGGEADPARIAGRARQQLPLLKRLYRAPFDWVEERTTASADLVMVNSNFTRQVFAAAFPTITKKPEVLYPTVSIKKLPTDAGSRDELPFAFGEDEKLVVSLNRFERKKDVGLAVEAFAVMREKYAQAYNQTRLVLAGGYDTLVAENVEYFAELKDLAAKRGVADRVVMLPNFTNAQRDALLKNAACLVYTPQNEHFGIVPVEAMYCGVPVVAANSGGPLESVPDGRCGFLREPKPAAFAEAISRIVLDPQLQQQMGREARTNAERFSFRAFGDQLFAAVESLCKDRKDKDQ